MQSLFRFVHRGEYVTHTYAGEESGERERESIKALYNPLLRRSPRIRTFRDEPLASLWPPHNATVYSVSSD